MTDTTINHLRSFVAAAEQASYAAASERVHARRESVEKMVQELERSLGTALFEENRTPLVVSAAGARLLPLARRAVGSWHRMLVAARDTDHVVRVGLLLGSDRRLLAAAGQKLRANAERSEIQQELVAWDDPSGGLASHATDLALAWAPLPWPSQFAAYALRTEPICVALPPGHELSGRNSVRFDEFAAQRFLAIPRCAGRQRAFWLADHARAGTAAEIAGEVRSLPHAVEMIAAGFGVFLIPRGDAGLYRRRGIATPLVRDLPPATLLVAMRKGESRSRVVGTVRALRTAADDD